MYFTPQIQLPNQILQVLFRLPQEPRPCSSMKNSMPNSTHVIVTCRLLTKASSSLLLIQISNDVESQPDPVAVRKGINICHWNVQHLTDSKFEEIRNLLTCPSKELFGLDILILSQTFCTKKIPVTFYSIPDYEVYRKDRIGKSGGGLCVYVKNSIQTKRRTDLETDDAEIIWLETDDAEIIWLETCPYKSKRPLFIWGIYRPPSSTAGSDKSIGENIENVSLLGREMILLGNINIDYLCTKFESHAFTKVSKSFNLLQLMNVITHPKSRTCVEITSGALTLNC